ncbi:MAG: structural protein [Alphaproteobacteria bacterium]
MSMIEKSVRGERNNNPLNVRWDGRTEWRGQDPIRRSDRSLKTDGTHGFVVFVEPVWGLRAAARTLWNYQNKHGLDTVAKIVGRWAPPNENETKSYVKRVAKEMGVSPVEPVDLRDRKLMIDLLRAMIRVECGRVIYSDDAIRAGVEIAGIPVLPAAR